MIDVAVLVTGDGDFVPLVRALNKQGVRVLAAYFAFETKDGKKSFINERLLAAANYAIDINALGSSKEHKRTSRPLSGRREASRATWHTLCYRVE